jgi:hypothetical protein
LEVFVLFLIECYSLSENFAGLIGNLLQAFLTKGAAYIFMVAQDNSEDGGTITNYQKHGVMAQKPVIFNNKYLNLS